MLDVKGLVKVYAYLLVMGLVKVAVLEGAEAALKLVKPVVLMLVEEAAAASALKTALPHVAIIVLAAVGRAVAAVA